jgi:hypothetical protein
LADDGEKLVLTIYGSDGPLAMTELSALHALTLAADLVTAARRRVGAIEAFARCGVCGRQNQCTRPAESMRF